MIKRPGHYTFAALIILAIFALASCDLFATPDPDEGYFTYTLGSDHVVITGHTGNTRNRHIFIPQSIGEMPVTGVADSAFESRGIVSVYIPYGVTRIEQRAFRYNQLSEVSIPSSVRVIESSSFWGNRLTKVSIPRGLYIGAGTFAQNHFESLYIPLDVSFFGDAAFAFNRLKQLDFADGFNGIIALRTFANNLLETVVIPPGVTSIHHEAFANNPLRSITIGADFPFYFRWGEENQHTEYTFPFGDGFEEFYIANGRLAGTYVRTSATSTDWRLLEE